MAEETLENEQLTDEELLALAGMFSFYCFYSEQIESLKEKCVEYAKERSSLSVTVQRGEHSTQFIPTDALLKRVMRSIDRLPSQCRKELETVAQYLITPLSSC